MIATAHAQSGQARWELHPMPDTLPLMFFSPDSLAGTMLEPLAEPENAGESPAAAPTEPGGESISVAENSAPQPAPEEIAPATTEEPAAEPAETAGEEGAVAATEPDAQPAPEPQRASAATVHVIVENVESDSGMVNVALCDTSLSQDGCPYYTTVPASPGFVEATIEDVPPGVYAVVGYHDVNSNDEFDRVLGIPREPYALSGEAGDTLVPDFADAALDINQGVNYVIIRMRRLGGG